MNHRSGFLLYRGIQALRREPVMDALRYLQETQWKTQDELREIQWCKVTDLLQHVHREVPHYRELMMKRGTAPETFTSWKGFSGFPVLDKNGLREKREELLDRSRRYRFSRDSTSGSSGPSTTVYSDYGALAFQHAATFRALSWYGVGIGMPQVWFWGIQLDRRRRCEDFIKDRLLNRRTISTHDLSETALEKAAILVERFRPVWIYGFTSAVVEFASFLRDRGLPRALERLRVVVVTGEKCTGEQINLMREVFGVPICNEYGCAEVGPIASSCPAGSLHLNAENVLVEVDPKWEDQNGARFGEAIVTELNSRFMPIVRYRLGDIVGLSSKPCSCGRGLPVLHSVSGRAVDFIVTPDGRKVHGIFFDYLPKYFVGEIKLFQMIQRVPEVLDVKIVKDDEFTNSTINRLERMLRETMGTQLSLQFQIVPQIEREPNGKYRFIKSAISPGRP